jgi:homoserine dehydrogenase
MSSRGSSIEAIIQNEPRPGEDHVSLIMLTNRAVEHDLRAAVVEIEALDTVSGAVVNIRVETLNG